MNDSNRRTAQMSTFVADTIIEQLAGSLGRLQVMTGAKVSIDSDGRGVVIKFPRVGMVKIQLEPSDTYRVQFFNTRAKLLNTYDDIYCDRLKSLVEEKTGLYLSL